MNIENRGSDFFPVYKFKKIPFLQLLNKSSTYRKLVDGENVKHKGNKDNFFFQMK